MSNNVWKDYNGTTHNLTDEYTMGDIAHFSSYATAAESPTAAVSVDNGTRSHAGRRRQPQPHELMAIYNYYGRLWQGPRVNSNTNPYAMMEGTSMATPTAAGIVALWLQAAKEVGKEMTVNDIKEVMRETAIKDYYTTSGPNASHFGNGKIDALAGIKYILAPPASPLSRLRPPASPSRAMPPCRTPRS